jgi:prepilin-type N-terminal cleavage/methylation domain-containing protein
MVQPTPRKNARRGFTLTEMLVVVAIIVVLAGVAVPITLNVLSDSKKDIALSHMRGSIAPAIKQFYTKHGRPPVNAQELLGPPNGVGTLTPDALIDPWQREYQVTASELEQGGITFEIVSEGPNPGNPTSRIVYQSQ